MNQKYASDCALCILFGSEIQFIGKMSPINIIIIHCCPSSCSSLQCLWPLEICFKIRQQLFIELYNKLCSKNAKSAVLSSSSYRLIKEKCLMFSKKVKGWIFQRFHNKNTFSFRHLFSFIPVLAIHKMDIFLSPSLMVSFTESEWAESPNCCYE